MSNILPFDGTPIVTVPAAARIATFSLAPYTVTQTQTFTNYPSVEAVLFSGTGAFTSSTFTAGAIINLIGGDAAPLYYSVGTDAVIVERNLVTQRTPVALNTTGALTSAAILAGIVTSSTAAAVTGTLPTGAVLDAANSFAIGDAFDWHVVNTGPNTFTVAAAASGHTVIGTMTVATATAQHFRTTKTAAATFVTYRM